MKTKVARVLVALAAVLAFAPAAAAQGTLRGELARLSFMLGGWNGTGWVRYAPDGPQQAARVAARGEARLSGLRLGWSSTATSTDREEAVVQNTDQGVRFRADSAVFRATLSHGSQQVDGRVHVEACQLSWEYVSPANPRTLFRYQSRVQGGTRLTETGERSDDGGQTWWAFYGAEMTGPGVSGC